jgi:hypothetical protein
MHSSASCLPARRLPRPPTAASPGRTPPPQVAAAHVLGDKARVSRHAAVGLWLALACGLAVTGGLVAFSDSVISGEGWSGGGAGARRLLFVVVGDGDSQPRQAAGMSGRGRAARLAGSPV